ncbi:hypothetical protein HPB50_028919 [Hyalomma asiaticum]|nr:hypothetical protein HPB50_028919 [Hyalomma asiaticum]
MIPKPVPPSSQSTPMPSTTMFGCESPALEDGVFEADPNIKWPSTMRAHSHFATTHVRPNSDITWDLVLDAIGDVVTDDVGVSRAPVLRRRRGAERPRKNVLRHSSRTEVVNIGIVLNNAIVVDDLHLPKELHGKRGTSATLGDVHHFLEKGTHSAFVVVGVDATDFQTRTVRRALSAVSSRQLRVASPAPSASGHCKTIDARSTSARTRSEDAADDTTSAASTREVTGTSPSVVPSRSVPVSAKPTASAVGAPADAASASLKPTYRAQQKHLRVARAVALRGKQLPLLPSGTIRVVFRPRGGLALNGAMAQPLLRALQVAAAGRDLGELHLRIHPTNNTFTVATYHETTALHLVQLKEVVLQKTSYPVAAYIAPPPAAPTASEDRVPYKRELSPTPLDQPISSTMSSCGQGSPLRQRRVSAQTTAVRVAAGVRGAGGAPGLGRHRRCHRALAGARKALARICLLAYSSFVACFGAVRTPFHLRGGPVASESSSSSTSCGKAGLTTWHCARDRHDAWRSFLAPRERVSSTSTRALSAVYPHGTMTKPYLTAIRRLPALAPKDVRGVCTQVCRRMVYFENCVSRRRPQCADKHSGVAKVGADDPYGLVVRYATTRCGVVCQWSSIQQRHFQQSLSVYRACSPGTTAWRPDHVRLARSTRRSRPDCCSVALERFVCFI